MQRISWSILFMLILGVLSAQDFANNSVLQSGSWYKLGITETGMYRLDRAYLTELGIDVNGINPQTIQLYGNGGGMVPQPNGTDRHDDLVENAIWVQGENDGSFDGSDAIIFYAEGPHTWRYNDEEARYEHEYHLYSDTNYVYLRTGVENGLRIEDRSSESATTYTPASALNMHFHEIDGENPIYSGRHWVGERFDLTLEQTFSFPMSDIKSDGEIAIRLRVAGRSDIPTLFNVLVNGNIIGTINHRNTNVIDKESRYYDPVERTYILDASAVQNGALDITMQYDKRGSTRSEGWLDWMEVVYEQNLSITQAEGTYFSLTEGVGEGAVAQMQLSNPANAIRVWDITHPLEVVNQAFTAAGNTLSFGVAADQIRRFVAFSNPSLRPVSFSAVANQDLHGLPLVDYLIITAVPFQTEAERLANFHRDHFGRSVAVVTPQEIYEEFSGGKQDVSAIRDFVRMFYERSGGVAPSWVLLFGDGTYIYKHISDNLNNETNYIPTYQSRDSWEPTDSYVSDDFFVILEEDEGFWGEASFVGTDRTYEVNTLDVAIGRLPVESLEEATQVVDKIITYVTNPGGEAMGSWRSRVTLVADHKEGEGNTHVRQANGYSGLIEPANSCINIEKIYMDNYRMETSAGLTGFPEGREALLSAMDAGSLILNYTGHGAEQAWSNSYILKKSDLPNLKNGLRLPAVVTATCEFGRYDNPGERSGAEIMTIQAEGGAIALFTTVRLVYSSPNETLNQNFYREVFTFDSLRGRMPTLGEVMMRTKNATFPRGNLSNINSRNFTLMGDPAIQLNYPKNKARITMINEKPIDPTVRDSLRSLGLVKISGLIEDELGNPLSDYNGDMEITVFDKPSLFTTRLSNYSFFWQRNRIFNGVATVEDGTFEFEFVVPIDISYENGEGKISLYFSNMETDGEGCFDNLYVGGTDPDATADTKGPEVELFMNDASWRDGGITSPDPALYAEVSDENGINTAGSGIGHEITAVLDGDQSNVYILNDFYTAEPNSYQKGVVRFPFKDLPLGEHSLMIRVWDVANNASTDSTTFVVVDDAKLALDQIFAYPNPYMAGNGEARFVVGHNQDGQEIAVKVEVLDLSGRHIVTLEQQMEATGNFSEELSWDGRRADGNLISSGMYVYRVSVTQLATGQEIHAAKKLVVIR